MCTVSTREEAFEAFVTDAEPRLSHALAAAYGFEVGADAAADALAYAWEHWERLQAMENPTGYLYRVGQSKARRYHRPRRLFPEVPPSGFPDVEPGLPGALARLSQQQRSAVVLVHGLQWSEREAAEVLGVSRASLRTHLTRGLSRLRTAMGVTTDG